MLKRYLSYLRSCYCISPLRKKQVGANQQNYHEKELRHYHSRRTELGASFFALLYLSFFFDPSDSLISDCNLSGDRDMCASMYLWHVYNVVI